MTMKIKTMKMKQKKKIINLVYLKKKQKIFFQKQILIIIKKIKMFKK